MKQLLSPYFGPLDCDPDAVVAFPDGLPGFEGERRFLPIPHPHEPALVFLQSLDTPALCFLTIPVHVLRRDYELDVSDEDLERLGLTRPPRRGVDVAALAIVSLAENEPPTANLLSPILINIAARRAVQAIRPDGRYAVREPLLAEEALCS